ncbi:hypothetical protein KY290_010331 [Solanum tuberosum]|uniref:Uncharacterized protein n=1 Tax=Solanum tuberosum TaxID=4113 RepID=A0ABQ7VXK0_SOLTU|nr:hypothetical protein KY289_012308 [Solanum tuberosum]KAH0734464.1 hypothetical protein KY285_010171 [Solanum tuberosum]KAH0773194.1 hypothetical protein KY290_010331 [Solanum tuberosum]
MASMIEQFQVAPPPCSAAELTLRLTYFDHTWLSFGRNRRILFYNLSMSKPDFVQTIIPSLKHSLSLALKHYTILAGNLVCPLINSSGYPELRYKTGDFVSVIFSKTTAMDFNYLIAIGFSNHHDACDNWFKEFNTIESVSIDNGGSMSVSKSKDLDGDLEEPTLKSGESNPEFEDNGDTTRRGCMLVEVSTLRQKIL